MDMDAIKKQVSDAFDRENNIKRYILTCSCFRMDKKASEAFSILFPNEVLPNIIKGRDRIGKFAQSLENDHIKALSRLSGKFAYYLSLKDDKITEEWDLLRGRRIA